MSDDTTTPPIDQPDNAGLLSALQKERQSNKELRAELRELKATIADIDIEALKKESTKTARTLEQERERATQLEKTAADLKAQLDQQTKLSAVRQAFFDAGGRRSDAADASFLDLVAEAALKRVQIGEDGKLSVVKADGSIDIDPTTNQLRDLGGLMRELAEHKVYGVAFEPKSQASGSGLSGRGGTAPMSADDIMKLPPVEMMQYARTQQPR